MGQVYNLGMDNRALANPYHTGDAAGLATAPFAGRQDAFGRIYGQISDPGRKQAILILGRRKIGKSALLYAAGSVFKETVVTVYIPLRDEPITSEYDWLLSLAQTITEAVAERGYTLSRLSQIEPPGNDIRLWFDDTFLPHILAALRGTRDLLLLFDDADRLLVALKTATLPEDALDFLDTLLAKHPQLGIIFTMDTEYESDLSAFDALVPIKNVYRLSNLELSETKWLMQEPVRTLYTVPDEVVQAVQRSTGGMPAAIQRFGYEFYRRWYGAPDLNVITLEDAKTLGVTVYNAVRDDYRAIWDSLTANERLVLTATSGLYYDDPMGTIDAASIERWLVGTDYPLDITAINAALRSLEYRELIVPSGAGVQLSAELLRTWLLENARRLTRPTAVEAAPPEPRPLTVSPRLIRWLLIALLLLIIANVIAFAVVSNQPTIVVTGLPQPTVTLAQEVTPPP